MKNKKFDNISVMVWGDDPTVYIKITRRFKHRFIINKYFSATPSSLARVMRAIQGKPVFGECCEWVKGIDCIALFYGECGCRSLTVSNYCPYCGRKIVIGE